MTQDIAALFVLRQQLATEVANEQALVPVGNHIVLAPGVGVNLAVPGPHGLFLYRPAVPGAGKVQITVQYQNGDTIRRINELNTSKYLTGSKIVEGEDAAQVAGTPSLAQQARDTLGTSSFSTAHTMLSALTAASAPIVVAGVTELTTANVGLIKLMVINDAMASTMTRHAA